MKDKLKLFKKQAHISFKSKFLKNFTPLERYEFLQLCHRRSYKEGEFVFYRNDPGTGMYFIEKGAVELTFSMNLQDESEKKGFLLKSCDTFGELSIGYNLRRKTSARCINNTDLLGFFKPDFEVLKERHPSIAVKFLQTLTTIAIQQLERAQVKIEELSDMHTAVKIEFDAYNNDPYKLE